MAEWLPIFIHFCQSQSIEYYDLTQQERSTCWSRVNAALEVQKNATRQVCLSQGLAMEETKNGKEVVEFYTFPTRSFSSLCIHFPQWCSKKRFSFGTSDEYPYCMVQRTKKSLLLDNLLSPFSSRFSFDVSMFFPMVRGDGRVMQYNQACFSAANDSKRMWNSQSVQKLYNVPGKGSKIVGKDIETYKIVFSFP